MPSIPLELQLLILESSSPTQYATLRLVCAFWKSKVDTLKILSYRSPPLIKQEFKDWCTTLVPPSPSDVPFLIHSALFNCTGVFHRTMETKSKKIVLSGVKRPRKKYEVSPALLENTQEFITHANEPLIIPDTKDPKPLPYTINIQYTMNRNQGATSTYRVLVQQGDIIGKQSGMTLRDLEEWMRALMSRKTLLQVPTEDLKKLAIQVGFEKEKGMITIHVEKLNSYST
ncbi:hypothetical protein TWF281_006924 [Arthrobotrys megalospora]